MALLLSVTLLVACAPPASEDAGEGAEALVDPASLDTRLSPLEAAALAGEGLSDCTSTSAEAMVCRFPGGLTLFTARGVALIEPTSEGLLVSKALATAASSVADVSDVLTEASAPEGVPASLRFNGLGTPAVRLIEAAIRTIRNAVVKVPVKVAEKEGEAVAVRSTQLARDLRRSFVDELTEKAQSVGVKTVLSGGDLTELVGNVRLWGAGTNRSLVAFTSLPGNQFDDAASELAIERYLRSSLVSARREGKTLTLLTPIPGEGGWPGYEAVYRTARSLEIDVVSVNAVPADGDVVASILRNGFIDLDAMKAFTSRVFTVNGAAVRSL